VVVPIEQLQTLVGSALPTGTFTVVPFEHWLMTDAIGATPTASGAAHPMYPYYATLIGMGVSLTELFAMFEVAEDDGVMAGETSIHSSAPMLVGATYQVPATILGIERKHGRRLGTFDLMHFELRIVDPEGVVVATVEHRFVFPRR
jgi:acyl dehydratase